MKNGFKNYYFYYIGLVASELSRSVKKKKTKTKTKKEKKENRENQNKRVERPPTKL